MNQIKNYFLWPIRSFISMGRQAIKTILRPVLAKTRSYLIEPVRIRITNEISSLRIQLTNDVSSLRIQITNDISSLRKQLVGPSNTEKQRSQEDKRVVSATHLHDIFLCVTQYLEDWFKCDIILTCPLLASGVQTLFTGKQVKVIQDCSQIFNVLDGLVVNSVGILSPWLMKALLEDRSCPYFLLMASRLEIVFLLENNSGIGNIRMRTILHEVGFYEVVRKTPFGTDDISIGCLSDGNFQLFGNGPGLSQGDTPYVLHKALRLPNHDLVLSRWHNMFLNPIINFAQGHGVYAGECGLAVTTISKIIKSEFIEICAKMCWSYGGVGHASLIGCYHGPSDTNMYACMLQVAEVTSPIVSLWINNGNWKQLDLFHVPPEQIAQSNGQHEIRLWFRVYDSRLCIGSSGHVFIDHVNSELERTATFGIRIFEDNIIIKDINIQPEGAIDE